MIKKLSFLQNSNFNVYNRTVAHILGISCSILLCELVSRYYFCIEAERLVDDPKCGKGLFSHASKHIEERTGLSKNEVQSASRHLQNLGLIDIFVFGVPPKRHFRLFEDIVFDFIMKGEQNLYEPPSRKCYKKEKVSNNSFNSNNVSFSGIQNSKTRNSEIKSWNSDFTHYSILNLEIEPIKKEREKKKRRSIAKLVAAVAAPPLSFFSFSEIYASRADNVAKANIPSQNGLCTGNHLLRTESQEETGQVGTVHSECRYANPSNSSSNTPRSSQQGVSNVDIAPPTNKLNHGALKREINPSRSRADKGEPTEVPRPTDLNSRTDIANALNSRSNSPRFDQNYQADQGEVLASHRKEGGLESEIKPIASKPNSNQQSAIAPKKKSIKKEDDRIPFGPMVRLSQQEYDKLISVHGESCIKLLIDKINDYCLASRPKGYLDYAAAIRQWIRRDQEQGRNVVNSNQTVKKQIETAQYQRWVEANGNPHGKQELYFE